MGKQFHFRGLLHCCWSQMQRAKKNGREVFAVLTFAQGALKGPKILSSLDSKETSWNFKVFKSMSWGMGFNPVSRVGK